MNLWADFLTNDDLLMHKWTHYFPIYERHIERFRNRDVTLLEIGVSHGGSLRMWSRFLGPYAKIVGIDINETCKLAENSEVNVRIGSQADPAFLDSVIAEFGVPDIVIDDGSHMMEHVNATFDHLYHKLPKNSVYLVEDLHTAYWEEYGGGLRHPGSFIEKSKHLIDSLNADHARGQLQPDEFTRHTSGMHFYDSVIVFEKQTLASKRDMPIGKPLV
jgi:23S rRNA U2552 (ribose-2'-O)-methylase RlmE/FtsJ